MNKYELALIVSAKIEDDARTAAVEKAKDVIAKFGGNVTNVEDAGKKRLAYEIQKMKEGSNQAFCPPSPPHSDASSARAVAQASHPPQCSLFLPPRHSCL